MARCTHRALLTRRQCLTSEGHEIKHYYRKLLYLTLPRIEISWRFRIEVCNPWSDAFGGRILWPTRKMQRRETERMVYGFAKTGTHLSGKGEETR